MFGEMQNVPLKSEISRMSRGKLVTPKNIQVLRVSC